MRFWSSAHSGDNRPHLLTAQDTGILYKAVKRIYDNLRLAIIRQCEREAGRMSGEIELDEAYFGGRRKGKRGRGAAGKSVVFGLLERDGRVYTKVVDAVSKEILMDVIRKKSRKRKKKSSPPTAA